MKSPIFSLIYLESSLCCKTRIRFWYSEQTNRWDGPKVWAQSELKRWDGASVKLRELNVEEISFKVRGVG